MAGARSFGLVTAVSALLFAASAHATRGADEPCDATNPIRVQDARLLVVPNIAARSTQLVLSGHALISDPEKILSMRARALCGASIGEKFAFNKTDVCSEFNILSGEDTVKPDGNAVEFTLSTTLALSSEEISIDLPAGESICAYRLVVEARPGPQNHFAAVTKIPTSLAADHAEFEVAPGVRAQDLRIQIFLDRDSKADPRARVMNAPTSSGEPIAGLRLQRFAHALLLSFVVALLLIFFEQAHPLRAKFGSVSAYLASPVTAAMAFYTAGALIELVGNAAYLILRRTPGDATPVDWLGRGIRLSAEFLGVFNLNGLMELTLLIAVFAAVLIVYVLFVWPLCRGGPIRRAIAFPFGSLFMPRSFPRQASFSRCWSCSSRPGCAGSVSKPRRF